MKPHYYIAVLGLALTSVMPTWAAEQHGHGHDHKPAHGGIIAESDDISYELVAKAETMTIYVSGHGKPVVTTGAKASGTLYAGNEKTPLAFEAAGDNKLTAKGSFKTGVGVRVAVSVTLPAKPEARLNFRLK
ncbi:MAG: hypothetical protein OEV35_00060 [Gallionellaceae bacterium]|nr:hypothetical protein [Gallionellaceae bacterium]